MVEGYSDSAKYRAIATERPVTHRRLDGYRVRRARALDDIALSILSDSRPFLVLALTPPSCRSAQR